MIWSDNPFSDIPQTQSIYMINIKFKVKKMLTFKSEELQL